MPRGVGRFRLRAFATRPASVRNWVAVVVSIALATFAASFAIAPPTSVPTARIAVALAASVVAGLAQLRLRFGSYVVAFEWGETALLLQFALVGTRWLPLLMAAGFCLSNVIGGRRQLVKVAYNTASWFLAAAAAVQIMRPFTTEHNVFTVSGIGGLALASATFAIGTRLLTASVVSIANRQAFAGLLREGAGLS